MSNTERAHPERRWQRQILCFCQGNPSDCSWTTAMPLQAEFVLTVQELRKDRDIQRFPKRKNKWQWCWICNTNTFPCFHLKTIDKGYKAWANMNLTSVCIVCLLHWIYFIRWWGYWRFSVKKGGLEIQLLLKAAEIGHLVLVLLKTSPLTFTHLFSIENGAQCNVKIDSDILLAMHNLPHGQ